jgi:hypothetical protein
MKEAALTPAPEAAVPEPVEGAGEETVNPAGNVHCAIVCPGVHAGADEAINVSLPALPVSAVP